MNLKDPKEAREIIKRTKEDDPDFSCYFLAKGFLDGWNQHAKAAGPLVEVIIELQKALNHCMLCVACGDSCADCAKENDGNNCTAQESLLKAGKILEKYKPEVS